MKNEEIEEAIAMKESQKESSETLHKNKLRSHGFHRPFEDKLKDA